MSLLIEAKRFTLAQIVKVSPTTASKLLYWKTFKRPLNLQQPQTFNEKLMWIKLFEDSTLKTRYTDKVAVRDFLLSRGLGHLLVPTIAIVDHADDIIFEQLPKRFVLKCAHASGFHLICKDKSRLDYQKTRQQLAKWTAIDYSLRHAEPHYANIKPRIIIEHFLGTESSEVPTEYNIHCFHGEPKIIELVLERNTPKEQSVMLTPDWRNTHYIEKKFTYDEMKSKPKQLEELLAIARQLSKAFTYVRVDLSIVDEAIYFGELTFTPAACLVREIHEQANFELGQWLKLEH